MLPVLLSAATFFSTFFGGLTALKNQRLLNKIMGYTAGVLLGVVAFDLIPEIAHINDEKHLPIIHSMIALVVGFLLFHVLEKTILIHNAHETQYGKHRHP